MSSVRGLGWAAAGVLAWGVVALAAAFEVPETLECAEVRLSLEGAPHSYWTSAEHGRIVLVRQCAPATSDCDHDVIMVWDWQGRKLLEVAPFLDIPEMSDGGLLDVALRSPDRLAVSVILGDGPFRPAVAEYDLTSGEVVRVVSTGPVVCQDLHGSGNGVLWCLGADSERRARGEDFDRVYRFDAAGNLIGTGILRSSHPADGIPQRGRSGFGTEGGFLPGGGATRLLLPAAGELVRFDDEDGVTEHMPVPALEHPRRGRLVSARDDEVYALVAVGPESEPEGRTQRLLRLDRERSSWRPVEGLPDRFPEWITVVGADEEGVVLLDRRTLTLCHLSGPAEP